SVLPLSDGFRVASMMSFPGLPPGRAPAKMVPSWTSPIFNVTVSALRQPAPKTRMKNGVASGPTEHGGSENVVDPSILVLAHFTTALPAPSPVVVKIPGAAA